MSKIFSNTRPDELLASKLLKKLIPQKKQVVILAIGSDRVTGDCLGPLVGNHLKMHGYTVYGDLTTPVTANNVVEVYETIKQNHKDAFIIAIDSAVGSDSDVGKIKILSKGLKPAAATGKALPRMGNISIIGIVSPERLGPRGLSNVRLSEVMRLTYAITSCVKNSANTGASSAELLKSV